MCGIGNLTTRKRAAVGEVLDDYPALRPGRVGDDPPRTVVGDSIVPHLVLPDLPLSLIGAEGRREERATWFIDLNPEWVVSGDPEGVDHVTRAASEMTIVMGPERMRAVGGPDGLAEFFAKLSDAFGAAYGCIFPEQYYDKLDAWYPESVARPDPCEGLGSVYWMQYLGPAFADRYPGLRDLPVAITTAQGATVYRATDLPEQTLSPNGGPLDGDWRRPLVSVLGEEPFRFGVAARAALPSVEEHAVYDMESEPAPLDLVEQLAREARERAERRAGEYRRAHARRVELERRRVSPAISDASHEWSTNIVESRIVV